MIERKKDNRDEVFKISFNFHWGAKDCKILSGSGLKSQRMRTEKGHFIFLFDYFYIPLPMEMNY